MEIKSVENVGDIKYVTVKVVNKLIKVDKVLELIDNIEDYFDKDGKIDVELFKEDILGARDYLVTIDGTHTSCTCKAQIFKKTNCRHIRFAQTHIENGS